MDPFHVLSTFEVTPSKKGFFYSLPKLEEQGVGPISRLPFSIRVILESVLRNCDGKKITEEEVRRLARWNASKPAQEEIPFIVARIVLQDFTGVPLLVDLAAMRSAMKRLGANPGMVEPLVPVDLVVDHSVQVDYYGRSDAMDLNLAMEFQRNQERYEFLKWGQHAFKTFRIIPPGIGIVHQVNLEHLAKGVLHTALPENQQPIAAVVDCKKNEEPVFKVATADEGQGADSAQRRSVLNLLDGASTGATQPIAAVVDFQNRLYYPDTLVGTDSHTTMINGLGVVGWGVGGIEAESGMLGQPVYFLTPEVVGVHLTGELQEGVTATDLALHVTQMLRAANVVGKFVEFYGEGAAKLSLPDRATIANMAPEYGATMGIFPVDEESVAYLTATGRTEEECTAFKNYFKAQGLFGMPQAGQIDYSINLELDIKSIQPSVAGPKRPQDLINLSELQKTFSTLLEKNTSEGGYGIEKNCLDAKAPIELPRTLPLDEQEMVSDRPTPDLPQQMPESPFPQDSSLFKLADARKGQGTSGVQTRSVQEVLEETRTRVTQQCSAAAEVQKNSIQHGSVLIAAITSCTNTSNPSVMLAAGLVAKKAVEHGLHIDPTVKTSLAPGSRVVTDYLEKTGLQHYLNELGFQTVGYGCTTCIGNSGPLHPDIEKAIQAHDLVAAAVLSGNRNFEARIHPSIKANFLMSPPLVVAFALAGRVNIDFEKEPIGIGKKGEPVFLRDLWPRLAEIKKLLHDALSPDVFQKRYTDVAAQNPKWNEITSPTGETYSWKKESTYIQEPPFFEKFSMTPEPMCGIEGARALAIFGDSVTTDHISPAGAIKKQSPAGLYLMEQGVKPENFNSYGSRRGNDRVMTRGTFANVRIKNLMLPGVEGGETVYQPDGIRLPIFEAAQRYAQEKIPLIIIAGREYGTGSSRDWAAKGTQLLGVHAIIARSYERIHRSNLVGMGVLPLQFLEGTHAQTLALDGTETYDLLFLAEPLKPRQELTIRITRKNGHSEEVPLKVRIDTPVEMEYYRHGGILPFILRQLLQLGSLQNCN